MNEIKEIRQVTILVTALLYIGAIAATFYPESQITFARAFGDAPLGLPCRWFARGLLMLVLAPLPLVCWHFCVVLSRWRRDVAGASQYSILLWILYGARQHRDLHLSHAISLIGQLYFVAVVVAWIWYTEVHGL